VKIAPGPLPFNPALPVLDDWILCRLWVARQETWSHSTWFDKCSIHYAYSSFF